jgi:lipopolysaccharide/colanic/teichoic acid biosynthesis glycosyltransferase
MRQEGWRLGVKRLADVSIATTALTLGGPLLVGAALAVRLTMGAPVLFRQQRPGRGGRLFTVWKLRTMVPGTGSDAARLTPVGRALRALSLDELPQLWNVLRGDMSLVGPRPLLVAYLDRYSPEQARRHDVLPGITGWAQINGWRGELTSPEKIKQRVEHDLYYIENWSLMFDFMILAKTPLALLKSENAY